MCSFLKQWLCYDHARLNVTRNRICSDQTKRKGRKKKGIKWQWFERISKFKSVVLSRKFLTLHSWMVKHIALNGFACTCVCVWCYSLSILLFIPFEISFCFCSFFVCHFSFRFAFNILFSSFCLNFMRRFWFSSTSLFWHCWCQFLFLGTLDYSIEQPLMLSFKLPMFEQRKKKFRKLCKLFSSFFVRRAHRRTNTQLRIERNETKSQTVAETVREIKVSLIWNL